MTLYSGTMAALRPNAAEWESIDCPCCGTECWREGQPGAFGPYGCPRCRWSEEPDFDLRAGRDPVRTGGSVIDQYGTIYAPDSATAAMVKEARRQAIEERRQWPPRP